MRKGIIAAAVAGIGVLLFAGAAKADDDLPPVPPDPDPDDDKPPIPDDQKEARPKIPPSGQHPPNISGDPAGYNTQMFPGVRAVRQWFVNMGYSVPVFIDTPLIKNSSVKKFQRDYNKVSVAVKSGKIKGLKGIDQDFPMGSLLVDGTAGRNTLNGLEIAFKMADAMGKAWSSLVRAA